MFTYFFLKALREKAGRDILKAEEIFSYIIDETEGLPYYARRLHNRVQTPQLIGEKETLLIRR